ncbi:DUF4345 domain-containing protein [Marinobacter alexandrii]|uniref:DUF4345 domain-containing protein n=1 Tax=Marinobacter alexandrii TaxID=2570351 RepID=UPI003297CEDF
MYIQSLVIYVAATFFLLYGLAFTISPEGMAVLVTQSKPVGTSALIDFRATYGGMTVAVGLALIYLHRINQTRPGLIIVILILMGMAVARTAGFLMDGAGNSIMYVYWGLEIAGSALALYALQKEPSEN